MSGAVPDKLQGFLPLVAGVGEGDMHVRRQRAVVRVEDVLQHEAGRAAP